MKTIWISFRMRILGIAHIFRGPSSIGLQSKKLVWKLEVGTLAKVITCHQKVVSRQGKFFKLRKKRSCPPFSIQKIELFLGFNRWYCCQNLTFKQANPTDSLNPLKKWNLGIISLRHSLIQTSSEVAG